MVTETFLPLEGAIAHAESWTDYLKTDQVASAGNRLKTLENIVLSGAALGELLPITWRLTFDSLLLPGKESWTTTKEFEAIRQKVHRLFYTTREAMGSMRQMGELLQALTGKKPEGMDRLLAAIENARQLEESVFRNWDVFTEASPPSQATDSMPVDESLAKALGITVEEARQRMDERRRELNAKRG
jgi:hypothetical protein